MIYVSETLLYICFAILTGTFILRMVPADFRPAFHVPDGLLLACTIAIPILSFMPVHLSALLFVEQFEMSYLTTLKGIVVDVNAGKAWLWTVLASLGLAVLLLLKSFRNDKHMPKVALFITMLLIIWMSYGSHSASLVNFKGIIAHAAHFVSISVWIGILFITSWFAKNDENWEPFLKWFSPVAIICFLISIFAGLILMTFTTPEYVNSWILPYGQLMLVKHLLILPLILFAYTNGFGYRYKLKRDPGFRPRPWLKAESVFALGIFAATAVLGQQAPPHTVKVTLQSISPSSMFTALYKGTFNPEITIHFSLHLEVILMAAAAFILAVGVIWMHRLSQLIPAFAMGTLSSILLYFALMFAVAQ